MVEKSCLSSIIYLELEISKGRPPVIRTRQLTEDEGAEILKNGPIEVGSYGKTQSTG